MPTITFDPSRNSSPDALIDFIVAISDDPDVVSVTSTDVVLHVDNIDLVLHGTGFAASPFGFTGDMIDGMSVSVDGTPFLEATNFNLAVSTLTDAIFAEMFGDPAAVENLFCSLPYTYFGNNNADVFLEGTRSNDNVLLSFRGADKFHLAGGADRVSMGAGNDTCYGDAGNDSLWGGIGSDKLYGGAQNDNLRGEGGNDTLVGGGGSDTLTGGGGADRFIFNARAESPNNAGRDRINDFGVGDDKIDLRPLGAPGVVLDFIGSAGFSGTGVAELRYVQTSGIMTADTDGNGTGDFSILLANHAVIDPVTDLLL